MKLTIKGYIVHQVWTDSPNSTPEILFTKYRPSNEGSCWVTTEIMKHQFDVEVPDDFDPRPEQIKAIQAEISRMRATAEAAINAKVAELQKLMAICNEVAA